MRWTPGGQSPDIEDDRDSTGGGGGFNFGGIHLSLGGAILVLILSFVFRTNLFTLLGGGGAADTGPGVGRPDPARDEAEKPLVEFVSFVLDDVQNIWTETLPEQTNTSYRHAKLVLFRDAIGSGCGGAASASGPFYCPQDEKVYIDLGFFDELRRRFGAPGQFAQAYVLAHELGHHVQKLLGIEGRVHRLQESDSRLTNPLSVELELQADCFAGIWAHSTEQRGLLEKGDLESALGAASAVGDDRLQKMAGGTVNPESFTHGTSEQRMRWFRVGLRSGTVSACNTFASP